MTENLRIITHHGWGFSSSDWKHFETFFPHSQHISCERGYFELAPFEEKDLPSKEVFQVVIAHSLGLHLLSKSLIEESSLLVICGGFIHFGDDKKTLKALHLMKNALSIFPKEVLKKFHSSCFFPDCPSTAPSSFINKKRLIEDLQLLESSSLDLTSLKKVPKILIFHGKEDLIVSPQKAEELAENLPSSKLFLLEKAGHGLFQTHAEMISEKIKAHYHRHLQRQKQKIIHRFSLNASSYDKENSPHRKAAEFLETLLKQIDPKQISGTILELGAGTGLVTERILQTFPTHPLEVSDISKEMLNIIKNKVIAPHAKIKFSILDGETFHSDESYGLIVSGMTFQWFTDLFFSLKTLMHSLKNGGTLLFSCQGDESFTEWENVCTKENIPLTKNALPKKATLLQFLKQFDAQASVEEKSIRQDFSSPLEFFHWLKKRGASQATHQKFLSTADWKKLLTKWPLHYPDKTTITHQILLAKVTKRL